MRAGRPERSRDISSQLSSSKFEEQILHSASHYAKELRSAKHDFIIDIIHNICSEDMLNGLRSYIGKLVEGKLYCAWIHGLQTYRPGVTIPALPQLQQMYRNYQNSLGDDFWILAQTRSWGATIVHAWRQIRDTYVHHNVTSDYQNMDLIPHERDKMREYMSALASLRERPQASAVYTKHFKDFDPDANPDGARRWEYEFSTRRRLLACELKGVQGDARFSKAGADAFKECTALLRKLKPYFELEQAFGGHGLFLLLPEVSKTGVMGLTDWCSHTFVKEVLEQCPDVRTYVKLVTDNVLVPAFTGDLARLRRLPLMTLPLSMQSAALTDLVTI